MQLFPCPFCGLRDETEFRYGGEAGKFRPAGGAAAPAADWSRYLYFQRNPRGRVAEIWAHIDLRRNVPHGARQRHARRSMRASSLRKESER